ncbi:MAG: hypothetical protein H0V21_05545 [Rubrobacter sp.]|nr:hypothetical protein [Rubrobacter sp.]
MNSAEGYTVLEAGRGVRGSESIGERRVITMRILIAYDDNYRAYREIMARTIRACRPHLDVSIVDDESLLSEIARLSPEMVICGWPEPAAETPASAAWMELPSDPSQPTRTRAGAHRSESRNPSLRELLSIVDETERRIARRSDPTNPTT